MDLQDILTIETDEDVNEIDYFASIQRAINSGMAWSFQGSYGRTMMDAIENGDCLLGKHPARDYWGGYIPDRDQVKAGTKGSYDFVADARSVEWADYMAAL
jgi:hypothetical protein